MRGFPDARAAAIGYRQRIPVPPYFLPVPPVSRAVPIAQTRRRTLLLGAPALVMGGRLAQAQAQPQAQTQTRPEKTRITLAVGGKTALYYLPITLAEQLKLFAAEGLDVELQDHAGDSLAEQSMLQGHADVAAGGLVRPMLLRQRGRSCVGFALMDRAPLLVLAVSTRSLRDFGSIAQLKGRRVGITSAESSSHGFARMVLARQGVAASDVEYVAVGNSAAAVTALREQRIDAISNVDPVISHLEFRGDIRVLADTRSLRGTQEVYGGPMPGGCLYAPHEFVLRYPQTTQALTNAVVRALKWLQTAGPSDIVRAVPEAYMYGDRAIYLSALEKSREALSPDGVASEEALQTARRVLEQSASSLPPAVRAAAPGSAYTNDFARRAKQRFQA